MPPNPPPPTPEQIAVAEFAKGILAHVEDGNVLEIRECGFVAELQAAIALAATYSVIHLPSGEEVASNFRTEMQAYDWLKNACTSGEVDPPNLDEYAVESNVNP